MPQGNRTSSKMGRPCPLVVTNVTPLFHSGLRWLGLLPNWSPYWPMPMGWSWRQGYFAREWTRPYLTNYLGQTWHKHGRFFGYSAPNSRRRCKVLILQRRLVGSNICFGLKSPLQLDCFNSHLRHNGAPGIFTRRCNTNRLLKNPAAPHRPDRMS